MKNENGTGIKRIMVEGKNEIYRKKCWKGERKEMRYKGKRKER